MLLIQMSAPTSPAPFPRLHLLRSCREWVLQRIYHRRGLPRVVNGLPLRAAPEHRWYFDPRYDAPVADYFRPRIQPGDTCLSIGANLGIYPLQFAHWSAPTGQVIAFEPNPLTAVQLRRHVAMNHFSHRIRVVEQAIANNPGTATFHFAGVDGMSRLGEPNPALAHQTTAVTVTVDTLPRFCQAHGITPRALMMDIEGFEIAALLGARALWETANPIHAVIELHPSAWGVAGTTRADLQSFLRQCHLSLVPLSGQRDPLKDYGHVALERC